MTRTLPMVWLALLSCGPLPRHPALEGMARSGPQGDHPLIALVEERTLTRVDASGRTPLFTFGQGIDADFVKIMQWGVEGEVIGAFAFLPKQGQREATYEFVLISTSGKVLFRQLRREAGHPTVHFGADGSLTVAGEKGFIARADGSVTDLGELLPMTPVLASGAVIVARGPTWEPASPKSLWRAGARSPLPADLGSARAVILAAGRPFVVSGRELVSLEGAPPIALPAESLGLVAARGPFLLLASESKSTVALVDVDRSTARVVANVPSPDARSGAWNVALGEGGAVLSGLRIEGKLQLRRTVDGGATWENVGEAMTPGEDPGGGTWLSAMERGGSVMVQSMSSGYGHFVHGRQFVTRVGTSHLAVDGNSVNAIELMGSLDISPDGQVTATWLEHRDAPAELVVIDGKGTARVVLTASAPGQVRFLGP